MPKRRFGRPMPVITGGDLTHDGSAFTGWSLERVCLVLSDFWHDLGQRMRDPLIAPAVNGEMTSLTLLCDLYGPRQRVGYVGTVSLATWLCVVANGLVTCPSSFRIVCFVDWQPRGLALTPRDVTDITRYVGHPAFSTSSSRARFQCLMRTGAIPSEELTTHPYVDVPAGNLRWDGVCVSDGAGRRGFLYLLLVGRWPDDDAARGVTQFTLYP